MQRSPAGLTDKVVVITGAARGLGRAYARGFVEAGAKVVATDLSWVGAEEFERELKAARQTVVREVDVRNEAQIDAAYAACLEQFGTVDVLINNAGMRQRDLYPPTGRSTVLGGSASDWERMFAVNVLGPLKMTQRFIRPMIEKRRGSVINVSSNGAVMNASGEGLWTALRPGSREQPYMSSKAALLNMTFYLADEVREFNVAVNAIFPGHTRTTGSEEQEAARRAMGTRGPVPLDPEHAVPLMLYLAAQDASGETGKVFDTVIWNAKNGHGGPEVWRRAS